MPPPRSPSRPDLDPQGYYARLGLKPEAARPDIVTAFRTKARLLHPDVPGTGNADAFMAVKQAYDTLSDPQRRDAYDKAARRAALAAIEPEVFVTRPTTSSASRPSTTYSSAARSSAARSSTATQAPPFRAEPPPIHRPRLSDLPLPVWLGLGLVLAVGIYQIVSHLRDAATPSDTQRIAATAAPVAPLSPAAHQALLYGPRPLDLPGEANVYVAPTASPALLYHLQPDHRTLIPVGQLPPFSSLQAVATYAQSGMMQVVTGPQQTGYVQAQHLTPGNRLAAHRAYCAYNAGPAPVDGEILQRNTGGPASLRVENHAMQPAVVRLRLASGATAVAVFLAPGSRAELTGLPAGAIQPEYAVGELWSRACNGFAAGMRAWRLHVPLHLPGAAPLVVHEDNASAVGDDIPDDVFERP